MSVPPRWAFERVELERCIHLERIKGGRMEPNPANVDVWLRDPLGWWIYHAWAAYVTTVEQPPEGELTP